VFRHPHQSTRATELGIGRAERDPVIVPAKIHDNHPRVQRQHVALELRDTLF
jgi:hypothetical protein